MFLLCSVQDLARKLAIVDHRRGQALGRIAEMRDDLGPPADHLANANPSGFGDWAHQRGGSVEIARPQAMGFPWSLPRST